MRSAPRPALNDARDLVVIDDARDHGPTKLALGLQELAHAPACGSVSVLPSDRARRPTPFPDQPRLQFARGRNLGRLSPPGVGLSASWPADPVRLTGPTSAHKTVPPISAPPSEATGLPLQLARAPWIADLPIRARTKARRRSAMRIGVSSSTGSCRSASGMVLESTPPFPPASTQSFSSSVDQRLGVLADGEVAAHAQELVLADVVGDLVGEAEPAIRLGVEAVQDLRPAGRPRASSRRGSARPATRSGRSGPSADRRPRGRSASGRPRRRASARARAAGARPRSDGRTASPGSRRGCRACPPRAGRRRSPPADPGASCESSKPSACTAIPSPRGFQPTRTSAHGDRPSSRAPSGSVHEAGKSSSRFRPVRTRHVFDPRARRRDPEPERLRQQRLRHDRALPRPPPRAASFQGLIDVRFLERARA